MVQAFETDEAAYFNNNCYAFGLLEPSTHALLVDQTMILRNSYFQINLSFLALT